MTQPESLASDEPGDEGAYGYTWFNLGVASWFGGFGMQSGIYAWLLVGELGASPEWVGIGQTASMLPALLLVLFGGAFADRRDPRSVLMGTHALAAIPVLVLMVAVATDHLTISGLIVFALCMGTIGAFTMPARDTLLSRVAGADMMRAVSGMTMIQFASQSVGTLISGAARYVGSPLMLALQALVLFAGTGAAAKVRAQPTPARAPSPDSTLRDIAAGLGVVAATPNLRVPILLVLCVGFLFIGPFLVNFPLLIRDYYHGTQVELSLVLTLFPIGTVVGSGLILLRGGIGRKGMGALVALTLGSFALGSVGLGLPFWGMVAATFVWGLCGAFFINCSRALYQEAAPPEQRGRVLSVYQLGFMGAAPLGAITAGFVSAAIGPLTTLQIYAAGMLGAVSLAAFFTPVLKMR